MDLSSVKAQLPGMARVQSPSSARGDSGAGSSSPGLNRGSIGSPFSLSHTQRLDPPSKGNDTQQQSDTTQERHSITSPPSGRISPSRMDRPASPTKGMGGFVQSAMMKRTESIKRWSVQSPPGLQRADSISNSNRSSYIGSNRTSTGPLSRPASIMRESSTETSSPARSNTFGHVKDEKLEQSETTNGALKLDLKPSPTLEEADQVTPPSSPLKTSDQRRWSPAKSSWLESALNKPESPKPKHAPHPSNQPAWMVELAKAKAQKAANSAGPSDKAPAVSHKHEVSIGGLMRSTAPGITAKSAGMGGFDRPAMSPTTSTRSGHDSFHKTSQSSISGGEGNAETGTFGTRTASSSVASTPKSEIPPKKDLLAGSKPKTPPVGSPENGNEVQNVLGKLRRTTTQNYVAPDALKDNILRGKAGLNLTGGPQKTERKDEFKEAILTKKKDFQKAVAEGRGVLRNASNAGENPLPEGLAKAMALGRPGSIRRDSAASQALTERRGSAATLSPVESPRPGRGTDVHRACAVRASRTCCSSRAE
jgi:hypothetical protein